MGIAVGVLALAVAEMLRGTGVGLATPGDLRLAFWMVAGLALLALFDSVRLPRHAGRQMLRAG